MKLTISNDGEHVSSASGLTVERTNEGVRLSRDYSAILVNPLEIDALIFFLEEMKHEELPKDKQEVADNKSDDEVPF